MQHDAFPSLRSPRAHLVAAACLAALLALFTTSRFWYCDSGMMRLARWHADSQQILESARVATSREWIGWWFGSWIEVGTPYYRPVISTLMGIEWKLFGMQVVGYCAVGWVLHAINAVLLFLLAFRISRGGAGTRMLMAFAAAAFFTLPNRGNQGVAAADVLWWPAQTDILSLTFALASLLALDRALTRRGEAFAPGSRARARPATRMLRPYSVHCFELWPALLLGALALGSKEMAITLPVPAALLALARRRDWRPVLLGYLALAAALLWIRFLAVPDALGPKWKPHHFLGKALVYLGGEAGHHLSAGVYWVPVAAAVIIVAIWGLWRLKVEAPWMVPVPFLIIALTAQLFGESWACLFIPVCLERIFSSLLFYLGVLLLVRARHRQPALLVGASVAAIHVPILHVGGVHYYYWPAAFWGLVYAVVAAEAVGLAWDAARRVLSGWDPVGPTGKRLQAWLRRLDPEWPVVPAPAEDAVPAAV